MDRPGTWPRRRNSARLRLRDRPRAVEKVLARVATAGGRGRLLGGVAGVAARASRDDLDAAPTREGVVASPDRAETIIFDISRA